MSLLSRFGKPEPTKEYALISCLGRGASEGKFQADAVVKAIRDARLKRGDAIILGGIWCDAGRFRELIALENKDEIIHWNVDQI